jgi:hypothetical protein
MKVTNFSTPKYEAFGVERRSKAERSREQGIEGRNTFNNMQKESDLRR